MSTSDTPTNATWRSGRTPRRGGGARRSRSRSVRTQTIVVRSAASARSERGAEATRRRRRAPSRRPYSAAAWAKSSPCGVAMCSTNASPCPRGRQEVEDPAAVVVDQHDHELQAQPGRGEQPADVVRQRDVADQQHDRARAPRRPRRTRSRPSRRSRSRRGWRARGTASGRAGKNVSTSRTGIEEATTSVASSGQPRAELGGDRAARSAPAPAPRRSRRRPRGRPRASASSHDRVLRRLRSNGRAPRGSRAGRRRRSCRPSPSGSCHADSGSKLTCSASRPASQARSGLEVGQVADAQHEIRRVDAANDGVAQQRVVVRDRGRARGARPTADRPAAAHPARSANAASAAPSRGSRSERPATTTGFAAPPASPHEAVEQPVSAHARDRRGRVTHGRPPSRPATTSTSGTPAVAVGHERLAEREVQVHGPGPPVDRGPERAAGELPQPADARAATPGSRRPRRTTWRRCP